MLVSGMISCLIFLSNLGACHLINFLSFLRLSFERKHEDGKMDAIAADGGQSLRRKRST
jgi:hypothetical protein